MTQSPYQGFGIQGQDSALVLLPVGNVTDLHQQTVIKHHQFVTSRISSFSTDEIPFIFQRIILLREWSPTASISGAK
ncbi:hypothetical protein AAGT70_000553 [Klebsiella variicola]|uniref:hypothetical protein n=1 Tax=Klebsiella michiganensis TaxID=1134687 RepID=UPI002246E92C|nr:hypothetical protein [Klebsiella michiganensis]MCW9509148.1 hypothetical protein [Klebsiella michiganensis]